MQAEKLFDIVYQIKQELKPHQIPINIGSVTSYIADIVIILDKLKLLKEDDISYCNCNKPEYYTVLTEQRCSYCNKPLNAGSRL